MDSITDTTRAELQKVKETQTANADLKKRKLVVMQKRVSFKIDKGVKFALELVKPETDLTAEMIAR